MVPLTIGIIKWVFISLYVLGLENTERISMKYEIKGTNFLERVIRMERLPYVPSDPKHEFYIHFKEKVRLPTWDNIYLL